MTPLDPVLSPVLVGRDEHLEFADRRLAEAAAGHGHVMLVAGEAGIGKTRLIRAIGRRATAAGFRVAQGDLGPQDQDVPMAVLGDLARTMRRTPSLTALGEDLLARHAAAAADGAYSRTHVEHILAKLGASRRAEIAA